MGAVVPSLLLSMFALSLVQVVAGRKYNFLLYNEASHDVHVHCIPRGLFPSGSLPQWVAPCMFLQASLEGSPDGGEYACSLFFVEPTESGHRLKFQVTKMFDAVTADGDCAEVEEGTLCSWRVDGGGAAAYRKQSRAYEHKNGWVAVEV